MLLAGSASAATEKVLYTFTGKNDGAAPVAGLTAGPYGYFYGTTYFGGSTGQGVVYEVTHTSIGWTETVIYTFQGGPQDGANPSGKLSLDAAGNIYGTASGGGAGNGIVFEITPTTTGWVEKVLHVFGKSESPNNAGVIRDGEGNLYGETAGGGPSNSGTIYEMKQTSTGWKYRTLYAFAGGNVDGDYPSGGLIFDRNGNLYGTTISGGPANIGTVFELIRGANQTWSEKVLHIFQDTVDGVNPEAPVVMDAAGNLYGTTISGGDTSCGEGYGCGTVFELSPASGGTWTKTLLHAFTDNPDGHAPSAGLTFDKAGDLFGTTMNGGNVGAGVVFEMMPQSGGVWAESVIHSFTNGNDGGYPVSPVIAYGGDLFGTTETGGSYAFGVVFELVGAVAP